MPCNILLINKIKIMKKTVLIISMIIFSCNLFAQGKFSLGPTAGFGMSTLSNVTNSKMRTSANAGLSLVYSAVEHFGIGLDVKYSFEGAKVEFGSVKNQIDLNYVRVPLKAIYFFNKYGDNLRPKIFAGPSFGFLTKAKLNDVETTSAYNNVDVALLFGAGLNYRMVKNTWFNVDVSSSLGLSDATKNNNESNATRNYQLNVGVNFGL